MSPAHPASGTAALVELSSPSGGVDFLDGTVFGADEHYLTTGEFVDDLPPGVTVSDYGGQQIFYRPLRERAVDHLTARDYLWRWGNDWFWWSRALGGQHPLVRRLWARRDRRGDGDRRPAPPGPPGGVSERPDPAGRSGEGRVGGEGRIWGSPGPLQKKKET